jgi:hypothetical protein
MINGDEHQMPEKPERSMLFHLTWNLANFNLTDAERYKERNCEGVHFANGAICLCNGGVYSSRAEFERLMKGQGKYTVTYQQEAKVEVK